MLLSTWCLTKGLVTYAWRQTFGFRGMFVVPLAPGTLAFVLGKRSTLPAYHSLVIDAVRKEAMRLGVKEVETSEDRVSHVVFIPIEKDAERAAERVLAAASDVLREHGYKPGVVQ